ncbi:hypothetical protein RV04_GL002456 [Enterococcus hermanniensis]|uniref:Uncharacterized protein n=1 Tax=Enterococcus hermanniensis TaxID=249189 RepID=A0A1L8TLZ4_9ENTE|nr:hypothetical protein RV04_GL002456 [Enterococcus hermanniensis]
METSNTKNHVENNFSLTWINELKEEQPTWQLFFILKRLIFKQLVGKHF